MIYRIRPSEKQHVKRERKPYRRAGADSVRRLYGYRGDAIDMQALFELKKLEGKVKKRGYVNLKKIAPYLKKAAGIIAVGARRIYKGARALFCAVYRAVKKTFFAVRKVAQRVAEKRRAKNRGPSNIYILAGAACGILLVGVISGYLAMYKLLLRDHFGSFLRLTVPDTVGMDYNDVREYFSQTDDRYNVTVSFEYSSSVPYGSIISQTPAGGAERKIYSDGEPCKLTLVVSLGKEMVTMRDYSGTCARDAELELRNNACSVVVLEEFSETVEGGKVISTEPRAGEMLEAGGSVRLYVSKGKRIEMLRVPDLRGLNENVAAARIVSSGFKVGSVTYINSFQKVGTVISQDADPQSELESGGEISFTVSAGQKFENETMPSLYGLTLPEAREKLAEYGLVCGNVYAVESMERSGTVIAQSFAAGSILSGTVISIDLYVSS